MRKIETTRDVDRLTDRTRHPTGNSCPTKMKKHALIIIITMYIYHTLINALSTHLTDIYLNIFYAHVEHSLPKQFT